MPNPPTNGYSALLKNVSHELNELDLFVKQKASQCYWNIGKHIQVHLLQHKDRAKYGKTLYKKLAEDVDRDESTLLRCVKFYRTYPIPARGQELSWSHYRSLITIKDEKERKELEEKVIRNEWDAQKLREYLSAKRKQPPQHPVLGRFESIPQLSFTRGKLNTYKIVPAVGPLADKSSRVLDLGFRLQCVPPKNSPRLRESDCLELLFREGILTGSLKTETPSDELFTYQATVDKTIDGDTLLVSFDFHLEVSISQKLRLRGIDCPEIDTKEGQRAKRFVVSKLNGCKFIIVKTYKDRTDKFDRYLADVFYKAGESDPAVVAREGTYLNQELLDERLAVRY